MENRQKIGLVLFIVGIPLVFWLIGFLLICIGIYFIIPPKEPGLKNDIARKRVIRGIGIGMLFVGLICLIGGIAYWTFLDWTNSLASIGAFYWIIIGVILVVIGFMQIWVFIPRKRKRKIPRNIIETSKRIVDYLKTDDSGITQFRLSSVLQVDHTKIEKSLKHLERLGVIEKKKGSAEEVLLFYKKDISD